VKISNPLPGFENTVHPQYKSQSSPSLLDSLTPQLAATPPDSQTSPIATIPLDSTTIRRSTILDRMQRRLSIAKEDNEKDMQKLEQKPITIEKDKQKFEQKPIVIEKIENPIPIPVKPQSQIDQDEELEIEQNKRLKTLSDYLSSDHINDFFEGATGTRPVIRTGPKKLLKEAGLKRLVESELLTHKRIAELARQTQKGAVAAWVKHDIPNAVKIKAKKDNIIKQNPRHAKEGLRLDDPLSPIKEKPKVKPKQRPTPINTTGVQEPNMTLHTPKPLTKGSGEQKGGLYNDEIDKIMDKYKSKGYKGTIAANEINKIMPEKRLGFIMNTDDNSKDGKHWIGVYIDARPNSDQVLEYYDSFAEEPPENFMHEIKKLIDKIHPKDYLKFKINRIKEQSVTSDNCGFFAMKFIMNRLNDKPWKDCTGYSDVINSEKKIEQFKNKIKKKFDYI